MNHLIYQLDKASKYYCLLHYSALSFLFPMHKLIYKFDFFIFYHALRSKGRAI